MQEKVVLIDYEGKYADTINKIEENQWRKWYTGDIRDEIGTHTHIKLSRIDDDIAGIGYGKRFGDAWCKKCGCKPCKCTNVIFVKEIR